MKFLLYNMIVCVDVFCMFIKTWIQNNVPNRFIVTIEACLRVFNDVEVTKKVSKHLYF